MTKREKSATRPKMKGNTTGSVSPTRPFCPSLIGLDPATAASSVPPSGSVDAVFETRARLHLLGVTLTQSQLELFPLFFFLPPPCPSFSDLPFALEIMACAGIRGMAQPAQTETATWFRPTHSPVHWDTAASGCRRGHVTVSPLPTGHCSLYFQGRTWHPSPRSLSRSLSRSQLPPTTILHSTPKGVDNLEALASLGLLSRQHDEHSLSRYGTAVIQKPLSEKNITCSSSSTLFRGDRTKHQVGSMGRFNADIDRQKQPTFAHRSRPKQPRPILRR